MSASSDARGVLLACSGCGKMNRVLFANLEAAVRCGNCKQDIPPVSEPVDASDEAVFGGLMQSTLPVLVDFWAEWCGPCKMMAPELDRFARSSGGRVLVAKVNTEATPGLAARFQISAIPTLALFVNGREVSRAQGARSSAQLEAFVAQHLRGGT